MHLRLLRIYAAIRLKSRSCNNGLRTDALTFFPTVSALAVFPSPSLCLSFSSSSRCLSFQRFALLILITDSQLLPPFLTHNRLPILYDTQAKLTQSLLPQKRDEHVPRRPHNRVTWYREDDECASVCEIGRVCTG
jgi:hypothetical protein